MEGFCRGCLLQCSDLLQYTERNRRLFIYTTGLQVKRNDTFTFQICKQCYISMRQSVKFKKQCRTSDMKFRNYLMLKQDGEDLGSFLKNIDAHLSLRLPLTSGHSTPAYKKDKDDENESTCTSIRNFMTEILDGEEMAPTEERIIREVIEEEADVLDDSLDSHWLQDEQSDGSDIEMDFGSSPFATPRLSHNDHCYTPVKINEAKNLEINFFTSKNITERIQKSRTPQEYHMPLLEDLNSNMEYQTKDLDLDDNHLDANADKTPMHSPVEFNNSIPSEVEDMVTENSLSSTFQCFKTDLLKDLAIKKEMDILDSETNLFDDASKDSTNIKAESTDEDYCIVLNQGTAKKNISNDLEFYVNKAEFKKQLISSKRSTKEYHCTIDRNLDVALKNVENANISLDQLITSPAVSSKSSESTPTIRNILFGEKDQGIVKNAASTPMIENILFEDKLDSLTPPKYFPQVGQKTVEDNCDWNEKDRKLNIGIAIKKEADNEGKLSKDDDLDEILESCIRKHNFTPIVRENFNAGKVQKELNNGVTNNEHMNILEEFLQGAEDTTKIDDEIIDQIIDPDELKDQDLFKRPMTPLFDKYDIDKCYCKICKRIFASQKALKIHFAKIHKYKLPNDDPHRNKSQRQKFIICSLCGKGIKGASHYAEHRRHHEMNDITVKCQCDYCKHFFESRKALLVHITKMHMKLKSRSKKHVCHTCGKISSTSTHHKIHLRRHLKEFSVFCEICNKGFYEQYAMKVHMRSHKGDCPYSCEYCPMVYRSRESFMQHMNRHLGKFDYKCDVCKKEYVTAKHLAKHFSSSTCLKNRERASQKPKPKEKVTVSFGKGSLDKIKKMIQSNIITQNEYSDIEDVDIKSVENFEMEELDESKKNTDAALEKEVNVSKEFQDTILDIEGVK